MIGAFSKIIHDWVGIYETEEEFHVNHPNYEDDNDIKMVELDDANRRECELSLAGQRYADEMGVG